MAKNKRQKAAEKAARTRAANARKRSQAAKKAAATRKKNARRKGGATLAQERQQQRRERARRPGLVKRAVLGTRTGQSARKVKRQVTGGVKGLKRQSILDTTLDKEPKPVAAFARRAIGKGQQPKKAIEQGRILHDAGRLNDQGRLKRSGGGRIRFKSLRRLIRL